MQHWFNTPHVQEFYSLRRWKEDEVREKLLPLIEGKIPLKGYVITLEGEPVGYIQSYAIRDYPWKDLLIPEEIVHSAAGLDLFIGDAKKTGKGLGKNALTLFLEEKIWPAYDYCFADPDERNAASCALFLSAGFTTFGFLKAQDALARNVTLRVMLTQKTKAISTL